jgi:hypothetical protein
MTRQEVEEKIKNGESLSEADLSGLDLSGAQLEGANMEEANLESANLSGANLSGANLLNANLGRADLSGTILKSSNFEGSNLRNANLSNADLNQSQFCEAYMGGASLTKITGKKTNFQGCYLGGADLSETQLLDANLEYADLEKSDLRNSRLQGCRLEGANLSAARVAGATLEEIGSGAIGSQEMDFSPEGDGSQIRTLSPEELEKTTTPLTIPKDTSPPEPSSPPAETTQPPAAPVVEPEIEPVSKEPSAKTPPQKVPAEVTPEALVEISPETSPQEKRVPFEKKPVGMPRTPEIKVFIGKPVTEEGMSGIALYMIKIKELFGDTNLALKDFYNKQGKCLLVFTTDIDANLFVSVFLLLHFFKFSYEVELKELYTKLQETCCIQPGEMDGMPVLDFWSLLPKFIKFPQAAFGFADFKKKDLENIEIILSTGQSINIFFNEGNLQIDYESIPYNYPFTVNIKDQLLHPISHQKGAEITELLHNLHIAVGADESMKSHDMETACFALSRFINEITKNASSSPLSPTACYFWSLFWAQIRSNHAIAGAARSICKYYPSLEILMT